MKKGKTKNTVNVTTIIVATVAAAFIFTSPMSASEGVIKSAPRTEGKAMVMKMEFVPMTESSVIDTEVSDSSRVFPTASKMLTLKASAPQGVIPVSPQSGNFSFEPKKQSNGAFIAATVCTFALHAADFFSTRHALQYSRLQEGNPFMKKIVNSPLLFVGIKLGVAGLQTLLLKGLFKKNKALGWVVGTAMNVALSAVVANNLSKINKIRDCLGY